MATNNNIHEQIAEAALATGLTIIGRDLAARILAVVYMYDDERIVYSDKLQADVKYIESRYKIEGGEAPDAELVKLIRQRVNELPKYRTDHIPAWATELFKRRYGIEL